MTNKLFESIIMDSHGQSETTKKPAPRRRARRKMTESRKSQVMKRKSRRLKEDIDEEEEILIDEPEVVEDDYTLVIDPELDVDEFEDRMEDAKETLEGGESFDDSYIGDMVYLCPVCGATFVSEDELEDGDLCPVCHVATDYVVQGEIAEPEEVEEESVEEVEADDEIPFEDEVIEEVEESVKPRVKRRSTRKMESARRRPRRSRKMESARRPRRSRRSVTMVEERSLNRLFTKLVRENYKTINSVKFTKISRVGSKMIAEGTVAYKSGKTKKVAIKMEGYRPKSEKMRLQVTNLKESFGAIRTGKRSNRMIIECKRDKNVLSFPKMRYNYNIKEGKKLYNLRGLHESVVRPTVKKFDKSLKERQTPILKEDWDGDIIQVGDLELQLSAYEDDGEYYVGAFYDNGFAQNNEDLYCDSYEEAERIAKDLTNKGKSMARYYGRGQEDEFTGDLLSGYDFE